MKNLAKIQQESAQQLAIVNALLAHNLKEMFDGLPVGTIAEMISADETGMLQDLMNIALETEAYEVCAAVVRVLGERNLAQAA